MRSNLVSRNIPITSYDLSEDGSVVPTQNSASKGISTYEPIRDAYQTDF